MRCLAALALLLFGVLTAAASDIGEDALIAFEGIWRCATKNGENTAYMSFRTAPARVFSLQMPSGNGFLGEYDVLDIKDNIILIRLDKTPDGRRHIFSFTFKGNNRMAVRFPEMPELTAMDCIRSK